jgi:hypothetical protein
VRLPNFDQFATQASVFTNIVPAGFATEKVIPSLLTGDPVDAVRASPNGQLAALHNPDTDRWNPFNAKRTVFQDALKAGYSTGVAGFYNPYCRILAQVLDHCFWVSRGNLPAGMASDQPLETNLKRPIQSLLNYAGVNLERISHRSWDVFDPRLVCDAQLHIEDYRDVYSAADRLLADRSVDFVFLHLPVPHPPGIYDRKLLKFRTNGASYLDNLVLADESLGHIRDVLEQTDTWNSAAVLVMGDHSWRTSLWSANPGWTPEDEEASHGHFDPRPGYILKLPDQQTASHIDASFPAVHTRALLDALMNNQVRSASDLQAWVQQNQ